MLLYIYERQQCGQVSRRTEIEQSGRNYLPWTPDHTGNGRETPDTKNAPILKTWFNWIASGRQQFVLLDGSYKFTMP